MFKALIRLQIILHFLHAQWYVQGLDVFSLSKKEKKKGFIFSYIKTLVSKTFYSLQYIHMQIQETKTVLLSHTQFCLGVLN